MSIYMTGTMKKKPRCRCYKNARDSFMSGKKKTPVPCPLHEISVLTPAELEMIRIERATFERDLKAYADYLLTIQEVKRLRRQNPNWRQM